MFERIQAEASTNTAFNILPLLYRMGQTFPVAVGVHEKLTDAQLLPFDLSPRAHLLMPLLEKSGVNRTDFLFIITVNELYDADDWFEEWKAKTFVYSSRPDRPEWLTRFRFLERRNRPEDVVEIAWSQIQSLVKLNVNSGGME